MTSTTFVFISTLAALFAMTSALSCIPCEQVSCSSRPRGCQNGWVKDACGCCFVCGNGPGEACQGPFGILGRCGKGLKCQLPENESLPPEVAEGTCVQNAAFKPEPLTITTDEKSNKDAEWSFKPLESNKDVEWSFKPLGSNKPGKYDYTYKTMSDSSYKKPSPNAGYRPAPMWYKPKPKENYNILKPSYRTGAPYVKPYKPYHTFKTKPVKAEKIKSEKSKAVEADASKPHRQLYFV